jgi:hypothetical protein
MEAKLDQWEEWEEKLLFSIIGGKLNCKKR